MLKNARSPWLLAALATVFTGLWLAGWRLFVILISWSDARAYIVPKYQYAAERMAAGHLPLWNPLEFGGIPFLATFQPAVLYPPGRLVTAVLAGPMAYSALVVLHILIAT